MSIDKELLKGCSKTMVLQLLSREALHGYEVARRLKELTGGKIEVTEGTLYPLLHSLEADERIASEWVKGDGKRKKKVYSITASGKALLKSKQKEWQDFVSTVELVFTAKSKKVVGVGSF